MAAHEVPTIPAEQISDSELLFTRTFDAPPELVFETWTSPEHLTRWWGPDGFTTTIHEFDARPGGLWRMTMHGPDGTDYPNRIVFVEVDRPARLVYEHAPDTHSAPVDFVTTVTFDPAGPGRTELAMRMRFVSPELFRRAVEQFGAVEGARQTLARLAVELAERGPQRTSFVAEPGEPTIVMSRVFDAPRALVFDALTKPEHLARWWGPRFLTLVTCEIDLREGGSYRFVQRAPDGSEHPFTGEWQEIAPPERLVFSQRYAVEPYARDEEVVTVTLDDLDGATRLTLVETFDSVEARDGKLSFGAERGARESWDRLAELLDALR